MASTIGAGIRGYMLAGCVLAAVSAGTVTQQSSSAWGSVADGVTVERGSHNSHTSDPLPDEPQVGLRGGFGGSRRQPSTAAEHDASQQPQPVPNLHGGFNSGRQPYAGTNYDASRHPRPASGPAGIRPVSGPLPAAAPAAVPVTPVPGTPYRGGAGLGGAGVAAAPAFGLQPGRPLFQPPDIHSVVTQMTSQVFQNFANSLVPGMPQGTADGGTVTGYASGQVQHRSSGGAPQPGAPRVQPHYAVPYYSGQPPRMPQPQRTGNSAIYPPRVQTYRE